MSRFWIKAIVATVLILGVAACAQTRREEMAPTMAAAEPATMAAAEAYDDWFLMIDTGPEGEPNMMPIAELLKNRDDAESQLRRVLGPDAPTDLAALLELAENDETTAEQLRAAVGSNALSGLAGFPTLQFLHAVVNEQPQTVRGKIRHYYFNDAQKSGYLEVDTEVDTLQDGGVHTDKYFWEIGVRPGTYDVVLHSGDRNNPFPGTIDFQEPKLTDIEMRNLDTKLWATGPGIVVIAVKKNGVLLDPLTHPLYETNEDSCIDMMFWGYPPTSELPPQPSYCLGRCAHPLVVNTD